MIYDCLIVDDEQVLAESTCEYFNMFGVLSAWVDNEENCLQFLKSNEVRVILLDINLGNTSGFALCKQLRATLNCPILFISARSSDDDVLIALNIGGDDYIQKPYSLNVLLAKVKAVLKRYNSSSKDRYESRGFVVDFVQNRVSVAGAEIQLKKMEWQLLRYLIKNKNKIVTKEELFQNVWGDAVTGDGTLNVHIRRLREKIEEIPDKPVFIKTIWGRGYLFEDGE